MEDVKKDEGVILSDIKDLLNIPSESEVFDNEILIHINSVISVFSQLWNTTGTLDVTKETTWSEYLAGREFNAVKSLVYLKVRLIFDPPTTSFTQTAIEKQIADLEYRLIVQGDIEDDKEEV